MRGDGGIQPLFAAVRVLPLGEPPYGIQYRPPMGRGFNYQLIVSLPVVDSWVADCEQQPEPTNQSQVPRTNGFIFQLVFAYISGL